MLPENTTAIGVLPESNWSRKTAEPSGNTTGWVTRRGSMMVVASAVPKETMPPLLVGITTDLTVASADRVAPPEGRLIGAEMSMSAWSCTETRKEATVVI